MTDAAIGAIPVDNQYILQEKMWHALIVMEGLFKSLMR